MAAAARRQGHVIVGAVDMDPAKLGQVAEPGGAVVTWLQSAFFEHIQAHRALPDGADACVLCVGNNTHRMNALGQLGALVADAVVDPSAVIDSSSPVGRGTTVMPGVVVHPDATVGQGVILNTGCVVEHDCVVGQGVHLSPRATLCGGVSVGPQSWIGAGAVVLPGVSVGARVIVGAGAVVLRDLPDGVTAVGNPARIIKRT